MSFLQSVSCFYSILMASIIRNPSSLSYSLVAACAAHQPPARYDNHYMCII